MTEDELDAYAERIATAVMADDLRRMREELEDHAQLGLIRRELADGLIGTIDSELRKLAAVAAKLNG